MGKMVIDSGATESVGSDAALEFLADHMRDPQRISIDPEVRQRFRFGNGSRGSASSLIMIDHLCGGNEIKITISCLETRSYVPILASVKFLRALGAKVDFEKDILTTRFGEVQLERTTSIGHLVPDLLKRDLLDAPGGQRDGLL